MEGQREPSDSEIERVSGRWIDVCLAAGRKAILRQSARLARMYDAGECDSAAPTDEMPVGALEDYSAGEQRRAFVRGESVLTSGHYFVAHGPMSARNEVHSKRQCAESYRRVRTGHFDQYDDYAAPDDSSSGASDSSDDEIVCLGATPSSSTRPRVITTSRPSKRSRTQTREVIDLGHSDDESLNETAGLSEHADAIAPASSSSSLTSIRVRERAGPCTASKRSRRTSVISVRSTPTPPPVSLYPHSTLIRHISPPSARRHMGAASETTDTDSDSGVEADADDGRATRASTSSGGLETLIPTTGSEMLSSMFVDHSIRPHQDWRVVTQSG